MTFRSLVRELTDSLNHLKTCAAVLTDAREAQFHIASGHPIFEILKSGLDHKFLALQGKSEGTRIKLGKLQAVEVLSASRYVSDTVDLHIDLLTELDLPVLRIVLVDVPRAWNTQALRGGLDHLGLAMQRHLLVLRDTPQAIAGNMLALIDQLSELDADVSMPMLIGFLRLVQGKQPTRSQVLALQIAGLVESALLQPQHTELNVTDAMHDVLTRVGFRLADARPAPEQAPQVPQVSAPATGAGQDVTLLPHAKLRIMERDYLIASHPVTEVLFFRAINEKLWSPLSHTMADGWTKVAAEIIQADVDVPAEFVKTHLIRRRDLPTEEIAEVLELLGQIFWLRRIENGLEARIDGYDWQAVAVDPDLPQRERAQAVALKLVNLRLFEIDRAARDWAHRMAHAVQVSPFVGSAAA